jgi:protein TonB
MGASPSEITGNNSASTTEAKKRQTRDKSARSEEDIRKVMDKNKGAIDAIYNRALRKNPTLEGKVVFKMVIEPNGRVSSASIVSSELEDPALERKLLSRIRLINFGAADVTQTTLNYSFDFLPF